MGRAIISMYERVNKYSNIGCYFKFHAVNNLQASIQLVILPKKGKKY